MKTVYRYHYITHEYIGTTYAIKNPKNKKTFILPAYTTEIPPLAKKNGYVSVYNKDSNKWEYIENHRGEYYLFNGHIYKMMELGKLPNNSKLISSHILDNKNNLYKLKLQIQQKFYQFPIYEKFEFNNIKYEAILHQNIISYIIYKLFIDKINEFELVVINEQTLNIEKLLLPNDKIKNILDSYLKKSIDFLNK